MPILEGDRRFRLGRPFDLVESKLRPPSARRGIVPRGALVDRLLAAQSAPVICVVAPPGYGKTTLLAQWSRRKGQRVGWVSVDRRDNDPVVLLTYLAVALDRVEPIDPGVFQALASPGVSVVATTVPRFVAAASAMTQPVTPVLDHVELLGNRDCLDAVAELAMDQREARALLDATGVGFSGADVRGSGRVLESLEDSNLLLVPLDRRRQWYRFHHLFGQLLLAELERREPELVFQLHARAAAWYEASGLLEAAIDHAQAAGDADRVARLVASLVIRTYGGGRVDTVRRWLGWFEGRGLVERYPPVAVLGAGVQALVGRPAGAERWADAAERPVAAAEAASGAQMPPDGSTMESYLAMLRGLLRRDGAGRMRAGEGAPGRLLHHRGRGSGCRAGLGVQGHRGGREADRGLAVRRRRGLTAWVTATPQPRSTWPRSPGSSGKSPADPSPP